MDVNTGEEFTKFIEMMGKLFKTLAKDPGLLVRTQEKALQDLLPDIKNNTPSPLGASSGIPMKDENKLVVSSDRKFFIFSNANKSAVSAHEDVRSKTNKISGTSGQGEGAKFIVRAVNEHLNGRKRSFLKKWQIENDKMLKSLPEVKKVKLETAKSTNLGKTTLKSSPTTEKIR